MQGALVGFGTIAMGHLNAFQQMRDLTIVAIVDPSPERRKQAAAKHPAIRTYESIEAVIANEAIDFIDICSPPHTHLDYIRSGLTNNCHVLCEKPLLLSVLDYRGILSLVTEVKRVLYPCHNYKFAPILQLIKNRVQSDKFGQIISGHFRTLRFGHAVGVPEWNPHWRRDSAISGGGILRDHGTHSIYIASHICGQRPTFVSCLMGNLRNDGYYNTEDTALMTLQFGEGLRFIIDLSWASSFRNSYYAVYGTAENMIVENDEFRHKNRDGGLILQSLVSGFDDPLHRAWFIDMFTDFKDAIATPGRQLPLLEEALMTSLVIERAYESAKQGGVLVEVPYPSSEFL
jgi:predicted dehydrogenase